jgi:hypothetical protein
MKPRICGRIWAVVAFFIACGSDGNAFGQQFGSTVFHISGRVKDFNLVPIEGVDVRLRDRSGETDRRAQTDQRGAFTVSVPPGTYEVSFAKLGFKPPILNYVITVASTQFDLSDVFMERRIDWNDFSPDGGVEVPYDSTPVVAPIIFADLINCLVRLSLH